MKLTKDDWYEIEKMVDIYSGWVTMELNKLCVTSTHYEAFKKDSPLKDSILELQKTHKRVREIADKLADNRINNNYKEDKLNAVPSMRK